MRCARCGSPDHSEEICTCRDQINLAVRFSPPRGMSITKLPKGLHQATHQFLVELLKEHGLEDWKVNVGGWRG